MRLSPLRHAAAVFSLTAAAWLSAAEPELPAFLPGYAAVAAGADFNALCDNPQSANIFAELKNVCGKSADDISAILLLCDNRGKRRALLAEFDSSDIVSGFCRRVKDKHLSSEEHNNYSVFLLKGEADHRRAVRMLKLSDRSIGVTTAFPSGEKFQFTPGRSLISRRMPRRKGVLFWGYGAPRINQGYLRHIREFCFVLEPDVNGKLLLYGWIGFSSKLQAETFRISARNTLPLLVSVKYKVPLNDAKEAMSVLTVRCREKKVFFSTSKVDPVFKVFTGVFRKQLGSLREIVE